MSVLSDIIHDLDKKYGRKLSSEHVIRMWRRWLRKISIEKRECRKIAKSVGMRYVDCNLCTRCPISNKNNPYAYCGYCMWKDRAKKAKKILLDESINEVLSVP